MSEQNNELAKLMIEVAFAAVNNNLHFQARKLSQSMQSIGLNESVSCLCQAIICFGLREDDRALELLQKTDMVEARALEMMIGKSVSLNQNDFDPGEPAIELMALLSRTEEL